MIHPSYSFAMNHVERVALGQAYKCCLAGEPIPVDLYCDLCSFGHTDPDELTADQIKDILKERTNG
jgi:hypothetical protein